MPIGEIAEMANRDAAGADFDIRHGAFSFADTIDPITMMAGRIIKMHFGVDEWLFAGVLWIGTQMPAINTKRPFRSRKRSPAGTAMRHFDTIGVDKPHARPHRRIFGGMISTGPDVSMSSAHCAMS